MKPGVPPYVIGIAAIAAVIIPALGCQSKQGASEPKTDTAAYQAKMKQYGGGQPSYGRPQAGTTGPGGGSGGRPGGPPGPGAGR